MTHRRFCPEQNFVIDQTDVKKDHARLRDEGHFVGQFLTVQGVSASQV
jgi:hypothetical protein